ncbi:conserved hypothetical protein, membrane [Candidatus Magnetobacterium bavaricum]|uniref:Uncharacterized protein n=1 Tax=Candidatus Magnetobacterium bavaricum TaxID=29290 RepID=A0A0F3GPT6_9BACT|nr:conserved hypothetical protein, membrane [Candidatus Magnetobacterium bavaricum]
MILDRQEKKKDRRKGPDAVKKAISWIIGIGWFLLFQIWVFFYFAMPEQPSIFDPKGIYNKPRFSWDITMVKNMFIVATGLLILSAVGLIVSALRSKRKTDRISITLTIMIILSVIGIFVIYFKF